MIYLAAISKKGDARDDTFPFNVPTIQKAAAHRIATARHVSGG
jgi:hypothetical protein